MGEVEEAGLVRIATRGYAAPWDEDVRGLCRKGYLRSTGALLVVSEAGYRYLSEKGLATRRMVERARVFGRGVLVP